MFKFFLTDYHQENFFFVRSWKVFFLVFKLQVQYDLIREKEYESEEFLLWIIQLVKFWEIYTVN